MPQPRARIAVPADLLRAGPPPRLVLLNAQGWQADLAIARTVYVSPADRPALRAHLRRLVLETDLAALPAASADWALVEALHGDAVALLAPGATAATARDAATTWQVAVARIEAAPASLLAALAPDLAAAETVATAAAVYAAALDRALGGTDAEAQTTLALLAIATLDAPAAGARELATAAQRLALPVTTSRLAAHAAVLGTATAFARLTAQGAAPPRSDYDALRELAARPERFPPRLLRAFVGLLGTPSTPAPRAPAARAA